MKTQSRLNRGCGFRPEVALEVGVTTPISKTPPARPKSAAPAISNDATGVYLHDRNSPRPGVYRRISKTPVALEEGWPGLMDMPLKAPRVGELKSREKSSESPGFGGA